ncbi:MAG: ABC transporter permease [Solirubrobacteraceae bacterium]|nr:ABC transporter permease [Solirubrobacteraceae bacterium]
MTVDDPTVTRPATAPAGDPPSSSDAAPPPGAHRGLQFLSRYGVIVAFALIIVIFSIARPETFPTTENLQAILANAAAAMIIATGLTVLLVIGDFDLSFGSMISLAGGAAVILMANHGVAWPVALLVGILLGVAGGAVNGLLTAYFGGSSFIITLAMGTVLTGVEFAITDQKTIFEGVDPSFASIAQNEFLGLSNMFWIAAAIAAILWLFLDKTEAGRYMYAIGGNPEAARLAGIRTKFLRLVAFVIVAVTAAIVGLLLSSNSGSYSPSFGASFLLPAFAAAFLGSAMLRPGQFNIPGTVIGVLFLGVIQTGLTMLNLQTFVINLVQGAILIAAVLLSRLGERTT